MSDNEDSRYGTPSAQRTTTVASFEERASEAAATVRDKVAESAAPYAEQAADMSKRATEYLKDTDWRAYADEVSALVRRYPVPSLLTGVVVGFLLARGARR